MPETMFVRIVDGIIVGLRDRDPDRLYRCVSLRGVHVELSAEEEASTREMWNRNDMLKELIEEGLTKKEAKARLLREEPNENI